MVLERRGCFSPWLCVSLEWPCPWIKDSIKDGGGENEFHMPQIEMCKNEYPLPPQLYIASLNPYFSEAEILIQLFRNKLRHFWHFSLHISGLNLVKFRIFNIPLSNFLAPGVVAKFGLWRGANASQIDGRFLCLSWTLLGLCCCPLRKYLSCWALSVPIHAGIHRVVTIFPSIL